jgi:hypothetical protein
MKKVKISFGQTRDSASVEIADNQLEDIVSRSRWRVGIAIINGNKVKCSRRKVLDGHQYKIGEQILGDVPDAFLPDEYLHWRDE